MKIRYHYHNLGKIFVNDTYGARKALDATMKFLRDKAVAQQDLQRVRSKNIAGIAYLGLNKMGDVRFTSKSEDGSSMYLQSIRFYDLVKRKPRTRDEILDMMRNSDNGVFCNAPSFLYWGAAYNATVGKYNIVIENRPPKGMRNQSARVLELQKKFVLCKHLIAVLRALPFYWNNMVKDFAEFFKADFEEHEEIREKNPVGKVDKTLLEDDKKPKTQSTKKEEPKEEPKEELTKQTTEKEEVVEDE